MRLLVSKGEVVSHGDSASESRRLHVTAGQHMDPWPLTLALVVGLSHILSTNSRGNWSR